MQLLGIFKTIFNLIMALPTLLGFIRAVQKELTRIEVEKQTRQKLKEMEQNAELLKKAQIAENEERQRDALSSVIDSYNSK